MAAKSGYTSVWSSMSIRIPLVNLMSRTVSMTYLSDAGCTYVDAKDTLFVEPITARTSKIWWHELPITDPTEIFYIQKSGNPLSGWLTIGKATIMDSCIIDGLANNTMNRHDVEYYRILAPVSMLNIGVAKVEGYIDLYGAEIARRHRIMLHHGLNGNKMFAFIRMRDGALCPDCWDDILQQRSKVDCSTCNDTGYIVGYYNPIELYVSMSGETVAVQSSLDGPTPAPDQASAWTSNFPLLNIGDMLLETKGNRFWEVQQNDLTMHKRVVTKQQLTLVKQEGDDPLLRLINRVPKEDIYGQSVFEDDAADSESVYDCVPSELFYGTSGVPVVS